MKTKFDKLKRSLSIIALFALLAATAHAGPRSSTNYNVITDTADAGGKRATSASYTNDGSVGGVVGISTVAAPAGTAKHGYIGQLYDAFSMVVTASPSTSVNEGESVRLSARVTMDDGTNVEDATVLWSVVSGPIDSISRRGLASAGSTAAASPATARAIYDTLPGDLGLTVLPLPYAPNPLTWDDPSPGGNGPYRIFLGTSPGNLVEVGSSAEGHFNPGQLAMGTQYWWQVLDFSNNDLTPSGGPATFTTDLYRPDTRIGRSASPAGQAGNNIYNQTAAGQSAALTLNGKKPGMLHFSVENDGDVIDEHRLKATRPSRTLGRVSYLRLTGQPGNVTASAITGGYTAGPVDPGNLISYRILIKPPGKKKAQQSLFVSTNSEFDSRGADASLGKVKAIPVKKR